MPSPPAGPYELAFDDRGAPVFERPGTPRVVVVKASRRPATAKAGKRTTRSFF